VGFRVTDGSSSNKNMHGKANAGSAVALKRRRQPLEGSASVDGCGGTGSDDDDDDVEGSDPDSASSAAAFTTEDSDVLPAWQAPGRVRDGDDDDDASVGVVTRRRAADRAEDNKDNDKDNEFDDKDNDMDAATSSAAEPSLMAATVDPDAELRRQAFGVPVAVPDAEAFFPDAGARLTVRLGAVMAGHKRDLHTCLKDGCACEGVFYKDFNCLKSAMLAVVSLHVTRVGADGAPARPAAAVVAAWKALRASEPNVQVRYNGEFAPVVVSTCEWVPICASDEAATAGMSVAERRVAGAWHVTFRPTTVTDRLNAMCCARVSVGFNIVDSGAFEIRTKPSEWMVLEGLPLSWTADKFNDAMAEVGPKGALVSTLLIPAGRKGCTGATGFARYASRIRAGEALFAWLESPHSSEQAGEGGAIASLIQSLNRVFKDKPDGSGDLIAYGVRHPDDCRRGVVYAQVQVRLGPAAERALEVARRLTVTERVPRAAAAVADDVIASNKGKGKAKAKAKVGKAKGAAGAGAHASDSEDDDEEAGWGGGGRSKRARTVWDVTDPALAGPIEPTMPVDLAVRDHFRPVHLLYSGAVGVFELPAAASDARTAHARRSSKDRVRAGPLPPIDGEQSDFEDYDDADSDAASAPSPVAASPTPAGTAFPQPGFAATGAMLGGDVDAGFFVAPAEGDVSESSVESAMAPMMPSGVDALMARSGSGSVSDGTGSDSPSAPGLARFKAPAVGGAVSRGYSFSGVRADAGPGVGAGRVASGGLLGLGDAGAREVDRLDAGLKACLAGVPEGFSAAALGALDSGSEDERREAAVGFDAAFRDLLATPLP